MTLISKHVRTLLRRKKWLSKRIAENKNVDLTYDKAEIAAITWVLSAINFPRERVLLMERKLMEENEVD